MPRSICKNIGMISEICGAMSTTKRLSTTAIANKTGYDVQTCRSYLIMLTRRGRVLKSYKRRVMFGKPGKISMWRLKA